MIPCTFFCPGPRSPNATKRCNFSLAYYGAVSINLRRSPYGESSGQAIGLLGRIGNFRWG
jgi:hypothetical protein